MALYYVDDIKTKNAEAVKLISALSSGVKIIYLDTETTGLDPFTCELLLVQIKVGEDTFVLNRGTLGKSFFIRLLELINKNNLLCVGHNIKFDAKVLRYDVGMWIEHLYDTMVIESLITAGIGEKLTSLATLVGKYCSVELSKSARLEFINLHQDSVFSEHLIQYAATDVFYLEDIYNRQMEAVVKANMKRILEEELELILNVCKMEFEGVLINSVTWSNLTKNAELNAQKHLEATKSLIVESIDTSKFSNALELADALSVPVKAKRDRVALESITDPSTAIEWVRSNFNVGSHKQLKTALNLAGIEVKDTNEKTLNKLDKNPIIDSILQFREYEKQISTYGYNILELINSVTGRIHTEYFQIGTVTGRFSSSHPNLQNIPPKYKIGFVSKPGYSFISMDYSQQEYRLAGALSKEPRIIEAYCAGSDMHTATAAIRFNKELKDVTKDERKYGKTMNFAVLYGTTEYGLMRNFSISKNEALEMLASFYNGYPRLTAFKNSTEEMIMKLGYSITPMGRRRYFKEKPLFATPYELDRYYSQMKREGFNMIIQGGGADVTKMALNKLYRDNPYGNLFNPILQVHDEILCEVSDTILDEAYVFMKYCMESVFQPFLGEIPALVDGRISKTWGKED